MIRLSITHSGQTTERMFESDSIDIGRSRSCDLVLGDVGYLSRRHCRISVVDGTCEFEDLSSRNGVRINGIWMKRGTVDVGDEIRLGDVRIELDEFGQDQPQAEAAPQQVRPCLTCGHIMDFEDDVCPACEGRRPTRRKSIIDRGYIPGWELQKKLGSGGMGIVFEAKRLSDGAFAAIKILKPNLAREASYLVRFVEETRVLTLLRHPNIVEIYGRGSGNGLTYIEMELIRGASVRHLIRREGRLGEKRALALVWDLVLALDYAAKKHVIHGDVKPSNFLLAEGRGVKLCDFGLARLFDFYSAGGPGMSPESSGRKGTAAYAAPERFARGGKPTVPGDIYSMGVSLFQMLTGELPFGTNKVARTIHDRATIPDPSLFNPDLRAATKMLIERMLAADPRDRYQTYRALQDDLAVLV